MLATIAMNKQRVIGRVQHNLKCFCNRGIRYIYKGFLVARHAHLKKIDAVGLEKGHILVRVRFGNQYPIDKKKALDGNSDCD